MASTPARQRRPTPVPEMGKGALTRQRILKAAIARFSDSGFDRVTTREIAADAGVHQPVLAHYFGDKRGLFHACADEVVHFYSVEFMGQTAAIRAELDAKCTLEEAHGYLSTTVVHFAEFMAGTEAGDPGSMFLVRGVAEPGYVLELFYDEVLGPGLELIADLIAYVRPSGRDPLIARLEAFVLISGLGAFDSGRLVLERLLGEDAVKLTAELRAEAIGSLLARLYPSPR